MILTRTVTEIEKNANFSYFRVLNAPGEGLSLKFCDAVLALKKLERWPYHMVIKF